MLTPNSNSESAHKFSNHIHEHNSIANSVACFFIHHPNGAPMIEKKCSKSVFLDAPVDGKIAPYSDAVYNKMWWSALQKM